MIFLDRAIRPISRRSAVTGLAASLFQYCCFASNRRRQLNFTTSYKPPRSSSGAAGLSRFIHKGQPGCGARARVFHQGHVAGSGNHHDLRVFDALAEKIGAGDMQNAVLVAPNNQCGRFDMRQPFRPATDRLSASPRKSLPTWLNCGWHDWPDNATLPLEHMDAWQIHCSASDQIPGAR